MIKKAVIPAAGYGTRFLPITKSVPKEMLPIVDKPVIQYVVEEAIASGITEILIIISRGKSAIQKHFTPNIEFETFLRDTGKPQLIDELHAIGRGANFHFIVQEQQLGLGDAIRHARDFVSGDPFAVLLGDTIIDPAPGVPPGTLQLIDAYRDLPGSYVSVQHVPKEKISRYGIVQGMPVDGHPQTTRLHKLIEKPKPENAPSDLAVAGRYLFTADIFAAIDRTPKGHGNEFQLTDAMNLLAQTHPMYAYAWRAKRYDIGNRAEYAECFRDYAQRLLK